MANKISHRVEMRGYPDTPLFYRPSSISVCLLADRDVVDLSNIMPLEKDDITVTSVILLKIAPALFTCHYL